MVETLIARAMKKGRNLAEPEAYELLKAYGLPVVEHAFTSTEEGAVEAACSIGFPVAMKVVSLDIIHKSDAGGVFLDLRSPEQVRSAYHALIKNVKGYKKDAVIEGALISKMAPPGIEVILGMVRDIQFGPAIMFGLGGVFVEVYKDVSFRILPIRERDAFEMIQEIKGFPLLKGIRGQGPRDIDSLVGCALKLARLVQENPEIQEIDLNPIRVYERGCDVLDARILLAPNIPEKG